MAAAKFHEWVMFCTFEKRTSSIMFKSGGFGDADSGLTDSGLTG